MKTFNWANLKLKESKQKEFFVRDKYRMTFMHWYIEKDCTLTKEHESQQRTNINSQKYDHVFRICGVKRTSD